MKGSRNVTIVILIVYFYVTCAYVSLYAKHNLASPNFWHVALVYWLTISILLRNWRFLITQTLSLLAFASIWSILKNNTFAISLGMVNETTVIKNPVTMSMLPIIIVLFVIGPAIFFSLTFDPYALAKDLARVANIRATSYLLLILSAGEMFRERFSEVSENLIVRGVNVQDRIVRISRFAIFFPPLIRALVQEAVYRQSYAFMLGCEPGRFPARRFERRASLLQVIGLAFGILLIIVRFRL